MKNKWPLALAVALLVALTVNVGSAQGPGTAWKECRNTAYNNYARCLDGSKGSWDEWACYVAGSVDLVACDKALIGAMAF